MSITAENYASEVITKEGVAHKFDDIGCMMSFLASDKGKALQVSDRYVRDGESGEWIHAEQASYLLAKEIATPMGYGVMSFAKKERAEEYLTKNGVEGQIMSYEELSKHKWEATH